MMSYVNEINPFHNLRIRTLKLVTKLRFGCFCLRANT